LNVITPGQTVNETSLVVQYIVSDIALG